MSELVDAFGRRITYLRVSVTDHCNYKCFYCRDEDDDAGSLRQDILTNAELVRIVRLFTELGVRKIRLTGGEPLVRKGVLDLIQDLGALPKIEDFSMSTNAHLLGQTATAIAQAGLTRLNISIDSLDETRFAEITRGGELAQVLDGIKAAQAAGLAPIKINMVVMKGINEDEIESMLDFAIAQQLQLRYIETMPIGSSGIQALEQHYPSDKILARVKAHVGEDLDPMQAKQMDGPARIYRIKNKQASVGVISAVSQHFCETCNRVRLTATGDLVLCLGQEDSVSLREAVRSDRTDNEIKNLILKAIDKKPEKHLFNDDKFNIINQNMVALGG